MDSIRFDAIGSAYCTVRVCVPVRVVSNELQAKQVVAVAVAVGRINENIE